MGQGHSGLIVAFLQVGMDSMIQLKENLCNTKVLWQSMSLGYLFISNVMGFILLEFSNAP